ncbi:MAG: DNA-3-methyladenine glycosylase I [Zoogloeaceae bacterium]|jgi:DNA-3-methyladenine glycosylase I|nr:DNA-3-methyladenine glycosylase I [Zoogloeaceae bacterium]
MGEKIRCSWAGNTPIYLDYHDNEWGRPVHDDNRLFEMLILESMQAGLSWITVLKKREAFRKAFDGFDPRKIALYDNIKIQALMENREIIRNRLKINAAINNAGVFLEVMEKHGSFNKFIWEYVNHTPVTGHWEKTEDLPASTPLSDRISRDLKKMGFKFLGSITIYSFMQAVGMVNDHITKCFAYTEIWKGEPRV